MSTSSYNNNQTFISFMPDIHPQTYVTNIAHCSLTYDNTTSWILYCTPFREKPKSFILSYRNWTENIICWEICTLLKCFGIFPDLILNNSKLRPYVTNDLVHMLEEVHSVTFSKHSPHRGHLLSLKQHPS